MNFTAFEAGGFVLRHKKLCVKSQANSHYEFTRPFASRPLLGYSIYFQHILLKSNVSSPRLVLCKGQNTVEHLGEEKKWSGTSYFTENLISFSRPHTIVGTMISVISIGFMAHSTCTHLQAASIISLSQFCTILKTILAALSMNLSIVGLNQIYDKRIDRINKPYLPLASNAFSTDTALTLIASACSFGLITGVSSSSFYLLLTLVLSLLLGVIYSADVKLLRWKQTPILAAGCILCVRAFLVQWGFHGHFLDL
jgi:4-hydroxybenzoate polyprenyltransferase